MAHEIETFEDGTAAFAGARESAWHRLGTITPDAMTAEDALKLAQLDWTVEKVPLVAVLPDGQGFTQVPEQFAMVRHHPKTGWGALGAVGSRYTPVQNTDVFGLLDAIVGESGAQYDTAGSLRGGRQVFMTLQLPGHVVFAGGKDKVTPWLMATNSHDGQSSLQLAVVMLRVVCANTLAAGLKSAPRVFKIRHTTSATAKVQQAREVLDLTFKYVDAFQEQVDRLLDTEMTRAAFEQLVQRLVPDAPQDATPRTKTLRSAAQDALRVRYDSPTLDEVRGTAWAAFNAVQEYDEWYAPVRGADDAQARRHERALGGGGSVTQKAWQLLTA